MQSFGSLSLGSRLKRLSDLLINQVSAIYHAQDIPFSPAFFPLFKLLHEQGPVSVTAAAEQLGVSHPNISKLAKKMQQEGWISKIPDPSDERRQQLLLTPQSHTLLAEISPIWQEIKNHLDTLMAAQQHPLLAALDEFETALAEHSLQTSVLEKLDTAQTPVTICPWQPEFSTDFKTLNMAWLQQYFNGELTQEDHSALNHPASYFLATGGYIWFARQQNRNLGCIALARHQDNRYEIAKMAVAETHQNRGIGRQLMLTALEKARDLDAREVFLESSTKLKKALTLYQHLGFCPITHPNGQSIYPRADIYLQLQLKST